MRRALLIISGTILVMLGILGLVLPFAPGLLFLLLGAVCFSLASNRLRDHLARQPRLARLFERLDRGEELDLVARMKLVFWACAEAVTRRA
ncbi:MAG: DUF454 family protein [Pseudomonadota bacterium]